MAAVTDTGHRVGVLTSRDIASALHEIEQAGGGTLILDGPEAAWLLDVVRAAIGRRPPRTRLDRRLLD